MSAAANKCWICGGRESHSHECLNGILEGNRQTVAEEEAARRGEAIRERFDAYHVEVGPGLVLAPDDAERILDLLDLLDLTEPEIRGISEAISALASLIEGDESAERIYGPDLRAANRGLAKLRGKA